MEYFVGFVVERLYGASLGSKDSKRKGNKKVAKNSAPMSLNL